MHEWKPGPLPKDTYNWGGVVPFDLEGDGFFFADFCGDHVVLIGVKDEKGEAGADRILKAHEVAFYTNCIELPPKAKAGSTRL